MLSSTMNLFVDGDDGTAYIRYNTRDLPYRHVVGKKRREEGEGRSGGGERRGERREERGQEGRGERRGEEGRRWRRGSFDGGGGDSGRYCERGRGRRSGREVIDGEG